MRTAIVDEERPKNFLIFGADEDLLRDGEEMDDEELVDEILSTIKVNYTAEKCRRVGYKKSAGPGRPIKVTLRSPDKVREVLRGANKLKSIVAPDFSFHI